MRTWKIFSWATSRATPHGKYRPDIDGMRALAVLAVIAYHYFPTRFPGGFIGVDIFFVISGYLITGILAHSFEKHSFGFTLWKFYQHRIRRIFPAVSIVLITLLVVGWLYLFPDEYKALGAHVAAGAGFVENILLWNEAGYFDTEAIQKPLLHFWSLAVEEQFYIFWPFILWFAMRRKWPILDTIAAIIAVSLALNIWFVWKGDATSSFYWVTMRTWELMVGSWLAIAHRDQVLTAMPRWLASQSSWLGLALILIGFAAIRPDGPFPGFWALLPVLGSALIIHAGYECTLNRIFLSWKPAVWIGLISYPLYLWHWSIWSMMVKILGDDNAVVMRNRKVLAFLASVSLSWMIYKYLETPIRKKGGSKVAIALLGIMAAILLASLFVFSRNGLPNRSGAAVSLSAVDTYIGSIKYSPKAGNCHNIYRHSKNDPD